jgi:hypothetical protein
MFRLLLICLAHYFCKSCPLSSSTSSLFSRSWQSMCRFNYWDSQEDSWGHLLLTSIIPNFQKICSLSSPLFLLVNDFTCSIPEKQKFLWFGLYYLQSVFLLSSLPTSSETSFQLIISSSTFHSLQMWIYPFTPQDIPIWSSKLLLYHLGKLLLNINIYTYCPPPSHCLHFIWVLTIWLLHTCSS